MTDWLLLFNLLYILLIFLRRLAAGTTNSVFIIDTIQKTCLLNVLPSELCNSDVGRLATPGSTGAKSRLQSASSTEQDNQKSPDLGSEAKLADQVCFTSTFGSLIFAIRNCAIGFLYTPIYSEELMSVSDLRLDGLPCHPTRNL